MKIAKTEVDTTFYFPDNLTSEISQHIFSFMSPRDLVNLSVTSKRYNAEIRDFLFTIDKTDAVWSLGKFIKFIKSYSLRPDEVFRQRPTLTLRLPDNLPAENINRVIQSCSNLQRLNVSNCEKICGANFKAISDNCTELTHLNLRNANIGDADFIAILKKSPKLVYLNISECDQLTQEGISAIASYCKNLKEFRATRSLNFRAENLLQLIKGCPNLEVLDLSSCSLQADAITAIAQCKNLRYLDLTDAVALNDFALTQIIGNCPLLKRLKVGGPNQLTSENFNQLLETNHTLTKVTIDRCPWVNDETLRLLSEKFPHLEELNIKSEFVTDAGIAFILERCPELRTLQMSETNNVPLYTPFSAEILRRISELRNLTFLSLTDLTNLTDEIIMPILEQNPRLIDLKLKGAHNLTVQTFAAIASRRHQFVTLSFSNSEIITAALLAPMIGPNCSTVGIQNCPLISEEEVEDLEKRFPHTDFISDF